MGQSHALVDSQIIIDKCNKIIERINKIQEQDNVRLVEEHHKKLNVWWRRFWRGRELGLVEAKYDLMERSKKNFFARFPSQMGESYAELAKSLKTLAKNCGSVTITLDDWVRIS